MSDQLDLVFLGTGAAVPSLQRGLPALAIIREGQILLCDCGEGTQLKLLQAGLSPIRIEAIFISHLHGDHLFGLPGLLTTQHMMNRTAPLELIGPVGIQKYITEVQKVSGFNLNYEITFGELTEERAPKLRIGAFVISAVQLAHSTVCYGFRFQEDPKPGRFDEERARQLRIPAGPARRVLKEGQPVVVNGTTIAPEQVVGPSIPGRSIVYCTDTRPCASAIELARDCSVLIHDSTFAEIHAHRAVESFHSTAREAAQIAQTAMVERLVLYHISNRHLNGQEQTLLTEATDVFPYSYLSTDLSRLEIPRPGSRNVPSR